MNKALLIDQSLKYKSRKDLKLSKPKEVESTLVTETKKKNLVIGFIYKHQSKFQSKKF